MDHVYGFYNNNASSKVQIKSYFDEYAKMINNSGCYIVPNRKNGSVFDMMGVELGEEETSMLINYCSADNLTVEGECPKLVNNRRMRRKDVFDPQQPPDVDLQTIKILKQRLKEGPKRLCYKYQSELFINYDEAKLTGPQVVPGLEILVYVRVYYPFKNRAKSTPKTQCGTMQVLNNVICLLGCQTLADLRDKISCIADHTIAKESSEDLENAVGPMAKDVYKSGFFYIEGTFYNDMRDPSNVDYSTVIFDWAHRRPALGPFTVSLMENCRIDSLCLRFGFPWVYKHQGGCEHLIVFSDARLMNCDDDCAKSVYPRIVRLKPKSSKLCMICGVYTVKWVTMEHERIPHNPCFFCDDCFKSYNYIGNKKVGKFFAYAYPRNTSIVKGIIKNSPSLLLNHKKK